MPVIVNNFIQKVLRLVREFFQAELYEYGIIDLGAVDSGKTIFIPTQADVSRVWFSLSGSYDPYNESITDPGHKCFVSEAMPVPGGFQFQIICYGQCRVSWFAIENE